MVSKRASVIILSIAVLFGFELTKIYVPENFEKPVLYRSLVGTMRLSGYMVKVLDLLFGYIEFFSFFLKHNFHNKSLKAKLGASLHLGSEIQLFRSVLTVLGGALAFPINDNVDVRSTLVQNVPVRVYSPKGNSADNLPIMIYCNFDRFVHSCFLTSNDKGYF
jgi:hypothetical protein